MTRAKAIPETITIHVPFRIVKRGGRKEMILPPDASAERPRCNNTMIKAIARAFRWKKMLDSGVFANIGDLASKEGIAPSYMTRVMRMTLLAPELVEAIVEGGQGPEVTLAGLMEPIPAEWGQQEGISKVAKQSGL